MTDSLLVELLCEELPPKVLNKLGQAFADSVQAQLAARHFLSPDSVVTAFATPRRLAVRITQVLATSPHSEKREKVLPVSVAFNADGQPQAPLLKKLAALGLNADHIAHLERGPDGKVEALFYQSTVPGVALAHVLAEVLQHALTQLPIPKLMSYQLPDFSTVHFVRPAHRLIALHGAQVLPIQVLGLHAGNTTLGHRFMGAGEVTIKHADAYESALEAHGKVVASFGERRARIAHALQQHAGADQVLMPDALLDEVTALVEWPVVLEARFDAAFLEVPQECLILTMQLNQKYFALADANGKLRNRFLLVSNLQSEDTSAIIQGNERVLSARLADAKFFYDQDRKQKLEAHLPGLKNVVYHNKLGSLFERVQRLEEIAGFIAQKLNANTALVQRAARLMKCDLLTHMVSEFPELQGSMGAHYARHDGEAESVARAIALQYQPRVNAAEIQDPVLASVYLAERVEVLVGIWGIGLQPSGEKDPFALRRAALGLIDTYTGLGAATQTLDLRELLNFARNTFTQTLSDSAVDEVLAFIYERLRNALSTQFDRAAVEAVIALQPPLQQAAQRVQAVIVFTALPQAPALAAANKRISNILKKAETETASALNPDLLQLPAEQALHQALMQVQPVAAAQFNAGDYAASLQTLASLREAVDAFFNDVMVFDDNLLLRANRLALLRELHRVMNQVADLARLAA